jgi:CubicO group peptidase (beta-lactamase class C family)
MTIDGYCDSKFERVREEFERNFAERDELGASVCVIVDSEAVVDLWGGIADQASGRPWDADTAQVICSSTKGAAALCGNMLVDRGQLDPNRPVADYWPQFAKNGKEAIPVRQVFNHQSGVFHWAPMLPDGGVCDWPLVVQALEDTAPFWTPGTRQGYHAFSLGYLIGELVRRVDGRSIGTFFREEVAEPLNLDFWIGLPGEIEPRVASTVLVDLATVSGLVEEIAERAPLVGHFFGNDGGWMRAIDGPAFHAAELPAAGGITNGRGLAGMYAPLARDGSQGDVRLVSPAGLARMRTVQSASDVDAVVGARTSYTMGFSKSWHNPALEAGPSVIIGEDAFGAPGMGGQMGFADPSCRLAFGYTTNRHGFGTGLNKRGQSLIDATYQVLGSPTCEPGFWVRPDQHRPG